MAVSIVKRVDALLPANTTRFSLLLCFFIIIISICIREVDGDARAYGICDDARI